MGNRKSRSECKEGKILEYCPMLVEHMAKGFSFWSFGGVIGVAKSTLTDWLRDYEDFRDARAKGEAASLLKLENVGLNGTQGDVKGFNATSWSFFMKNRFNWKDKIETENLNDNINTSAVTAEDRKKLLDDVLNAREYHERQRQNELHKKD